MSDSCEQVLDFLEGSGFSLKRGEFTAFEMKFPLVQGVAWDSTTAQLALVAGAEDERDENRESWKQLLFAAAGLRYQMAEAGPSAFGAPLVLAVVDGDGEQLLRDLVEEMARDYAVFTRVDLNFVKRADLGDEELLMDALAPLLPRCRAGLLKRISKDEVRRFWAVLRERIRETAEQLDGAFEGYRTAAGVAAADFLVGDLDQRPDLPSLEPIWDLRLEDFRSFGEAEVDLSPVTVIHGGNGSGKSAMLEGLELLWAGTSQRKPWAVDAAEYGRHLPHGGSGDFRVEGGGDREVVEVSEQPLAELARCVLTQEQIGALVESDPGQRYAQLLAVTGLEVPDLDAHTDAFLTQAKSVADKALEKAGLPPLKTRGANALKHLHDELRSQFASRLPQRDELVGVERLLSDVSDGAFSLRSWPDDRDAAEALAAADRALAEMPSELADLSPLERAASVVEKLAASRREVARSVRLLVDAMARAGRGRAAGRDEAAGTAPVATEEEMPRALAAQWLGHGRSLTEAAAGFEEAVDGLDSPAWEKRLAAYVAALRAAAAAVPDKALERLLRAATPAAPAPPEPEAGVPERRFVEAGFSRAPAARAQVVEVLGEYVNVLERQAAELDALATEIERHPVRQFGEHASRVLASACEFEIARKLRRRGGGPIKEASQELVVELLQGVLAPIVRELVAAFVRFEWYFKPLIVRERDGELVLAGLATTQEELDARMLLNSAERNVVGLAWFLALHLLQPPERRRVLAIDDASAAFDTSNQAGFVSTIRAFVRLAKPEQTVLLSHSDAVAASLAAELAPVDGWPRSMRRIRCSRDGGDRSVVDPVEHREESRALDDEIERLGLGQGMAVA